MSGWIIEIKHETYQNHDLKISQKKNYGSSLNHALQKSRLMCVSFELLENKLLVKCIVDGQFKQFQSLCLSVACVIWMFGRVCV